MVQITLALSCSPARKALIKQITDGVGHFSSTINQLVISKSILETGDQEAMSHPDVMQAMFDVLRELEGLRLTTYTDTHGYRTIGIGFNLDQWGKTISARQQSLYPLLYASGVASGQAEAVYQGSMSITNSQAKALFGLTIHGRDSHGKHVFGQHKAGVLKSQLLKTLSPQASLSLRHVLVCQSLVFTNAFLVGPSLRGYLASGDINHAALEIAAHSNRKIAASGKANPGCHGLANRRLFEAALLSGDAEYRLPEDEVLALISWAEKAISQGVNPNGGTISPSEPLTIAFSGGSPQLTNYKPFGSRPSAKFLVHA